MSDSLKRVQEILVDKLVLDEEPKMESDIFNDLGCDSLDAVEIIMECEKDFNIVISDEDAEQVRTVGDIVKIVDERTGKA